MIGKLKGRLLAAYLHRLLNDPLAETKIALFKSDKWKKQYQATGQNLIRVNFYPSDEDWAELSLLSFSSGLSRCYVFTILMLFDLGVLKLPDNGTPTSHFKKNRKNRIICIVKLDLRKKTFERMLKKTNQPLIFTIGFT